MNSNEFIDRYWWDDDLKRNNKKYGIVTACVGGGQGIAGVFENLI